MQQGNVFFYDYIDEQAINSLYSQTDDFVLETNFSSDEGLSGSINLSTSIFNLFKAGAKTTANTKEVQSEKIQITVEQRIPKLMKFLKKNDLLIDITEDQNLNITDNCSVFVEINNTFTIDNVRDVLNVSHGSIFQMVRFQNNPESISPNDHPTILLSTTVNNNIYQMRTSLLKYRTSFHHVMESWNNTYVNNHSSLQAKLRVFGLLSKKSDNLYYIKPFSIARG
ncbi:hypothetical protein OWP15_11545 [Bacillus paranthracis]|uniref:hypothetical protein n=1 Tax=Bacillus paranthracis TaxID=2026186 RepID=UPI000789D730|nr:hypothetical protein [Bacillus paranthracis]KYQ01859.1 hypothetical protein B4079_3141 [Bacillus cereus]MDK7473349.1 hypothetical protein [Bacillus paranthracis]